MDGDGLIDIIIGNLHDPIQLLLNRGNATFKEEKIDALSSANYETFSATVADVDGDGHPDLFIGYYDGPNQLLLNVGDGTFQEAAYMIPSSEVLNTNSIAVADFNNDGQLDIVIGNNGKRNQIMVFSECSSGASLHGSSWCFPCPSFMGRSIVMGLPLCWECSPDHIQDESNEQCSPEPCFSFEERKLGGNLCSPCPDGSFYDTSVVRSESQPLSFLQERCGSCEAGTFYSKAIHATGTAVSKCYSCQPSLSSSSGSATCSYCNEGCFLNSIETVESISNEGDCTKCPPNARCDVNTTLGTLGVPLKYWRGSLNTSALYFCKGGNPERCSGNSTRATSPNDYCEQGYHGPLCKLCEGEDQYFNDSHGKCLDCDEFPFLKVIGVIVVLLSGLLGTYSLGKKFQNLRSRGFQTKVKILISFYQVSCCYFSICLRDATP